ncbi:MAG: hypothetical protein WAW41_00020, partial [Methylobacter sp.]
MIRKGIFHVFLILSISVLSQALYETKCLADSDSPDSKFEVIYHSNFNSLKKLYSKSAEDGIKVINIFLENYSKVLRREVNLAPKERYLLWRDKGIGIKLVISTRNESLLYFFPNKTNQIFIDGINFPVQSALLYGFLDLNTPKNEI